MAPLHNDHSSQTLQLPKSPIIKKEEQEEDQAAEMIAKQEEEQQPQPQPQPQPKKQKKQKKEVKVESRSPLLTPPSAPENFSGRSSSSPEVEVVPRPEPVKSEDQEPSVGSSVVPVKGSSDDTSRELKYPAALLKYRKVLQLRSSPKREATLQKWLPLANQLMAAHVKKLAELRAEKLEAAAAAPMESCESREKEEVEVAAAGAERASCCPHHEVEASEEDDSDDDDDSDSDSDDEDWWPGKNLGWSRDEGMEYREGQPVYGDGY
ncbi:hypothetical protein NEUTE1DRAFT_111685 [Neurospora tetrasperma FGSC 2508]|uniref:Uncharacterized protein n=1 Tax=Neurospora tetrasperma (strain FGSC 2508 / ATCC MYA-4615 / P0657) TaxID=510951 RepID=F8MST8_NEUT8|nr:uncharacterized protein NEUTE1DRAFT_111685 [Neurospora tetrasperma FGSC 2508]EGO55121.1 hypothetical protein NEUTE1DRAFT_111685 [Neurospora tetrasperma FGSC 2508]